MTLCNFRNIILIWNKIIDKEKKTIEKCVEINYKIFQNQKYDI
jgi:hypothetical protein